MQQIDLATILKSKNPRLAKSLPRFVIGWGEAILRLKDHNAILARYSHLDAEGFMDSCLNYIGVDYVLHGTEKIPRDGSKVLFASNHPLGGVDGIIMGTAIKKLDLGGVKLIVNDLLLNLEPLRSVFVGVNKHGAQKSELNREFEELYNSDAPIVNFPAGLCSRRIKGEIIDTPWKSSYVNRCKKSGRVVIPTYVDARNSMAFYRFARLRKFLGIKSNLEMMLLPRQVFFQRGKTINIYFGEPILVDDSRTAKAWNDHIRAKAYELKKKK